MNRNHSQTLYFSENYRDRIQHNYSGLTSSEKTAADYILKNGPQCITMSVQEIAEKSGCSSATVMRFCNAIGYSGISELKYHMKEMSSDFSAENVSISYQDSASSIKHEILQFTNLNLNKTVEILDSESITKAASALAGAGRIVLCSMGSASGVALAAAHHFLSLGKDSSFYSDELMILRSVSNLSENDVLIGINYDGYSRTVADAFKLAHSRGVTTIFITSFTQSLIAKYADIILQTPLRNNLNILNFSSTTICQMMIIQILISSTWQYGGKDLDERSKSLRKLTNMKRYPKDTPM